VAAEKGSFKSAAGHLFVSAAAISQQIRQLEEWLDCQLFVRQHRKVILTAEGETLFHSSKKGFSYLQEGVRNLNQDPEPNRLSISILPTFAQYWLIPRINHFRSQFPQFSLLIDPKNELIDFQDGLVDICVRYGHGQYSNVESVWLMDEILYPVCHPNYQEQHHIFDIEDLIRVDLIEDVWPDMNWSLWFDKMNLRSGQTSIKYDGSQFVMEGALAAQGVALAKHSSACRYITEGKLVRIGKYGVKSRYSYYLCAPKGYFHREKVTLFLAWIQEQVQAYKNCDSGDINLLSLPQDKDAVIALNELEP